MRRQEEPFSNPISLLTEVRPSPINGWGVFAKVPIPRQTVWWRVRPTDVVQIHKVHLEALHASAQSPRTRAFLDAVLENGYYVAGYDTLFYLTDNGRFVNHSFQPNSAVCPNSDGLCSVALRDIAAGEEILEDYTKYDKCPWANLYGEFGRQIGCWTLPESNSPRGRPVEAS
jgi:SET domain-containing protein